MVVRMCADSEPNIQWVKPDRSKSHSPKKYAIRKEASADPDTSFNESSQFLQDGFLRIPIESLSKALLLQIIEALLKGTHVTRTDLHDDTDLQNATVDSSGGNTCVILNRDKMHIVEKSLGLTKILKNTSLSTRKALVEGLKNVSRIKGP